MSCACKIGGGPDGVCFECKSRRAFHARLEKLEKQATLLDEAYARGVADEQPCAEQVCLVERLPGDVVLSREDVASIMEAMTSAVVAMDSEGWDSVPEDEGSGATTLNNLREASMLLRGRR